MVLKFVSMYFYPYARCLTVKVLAETVKVLSGPPLELSSLRCTVRRRRL